MAAALPDFDFGALPLAQIREEARRHLVDILDSRRGKKVLVLDSKISGFLGLLAEVSLFREHGVDQLQHLGSEPLNDAEVRSIIFLVRARIENAQLVAGQVKQCIRRGRPLEFSVFFLPRRTIVCEKVFQEAGISADVTIGEFPLDFIPFDSDVLSLELDAAFKVRNMAQETVLDGDWSSSFLMARGLMQLQQLFGPIPVIKGKGPAADAVAEGLARMTEAATASLSLPGTSTVDELILIDREADCITPMCTQLTYEGLLDEVLGIKNGAVTLEPGESAAKQRMVLNSSDKTFQHIRDWHIGSVGIWLNEQAKSFHSGYKGSKAAELKELKEFTTKLKSLPQIQRHIELLSAVQAVSGRPGFRERVSMEQAVLDAGAADGACQFAEDMMCNEESLESVLRLLCLTSLTQGGLPRKNFDSLRRELLHTYGHQHLLTLSALQSAGLLTASKGGKPPFQQLRKALNLMVEDFDPRDPADPAYVFSGYAPISVRLVQAALRTPSWSGIPEDALKLLPGKHFTRKQRGIRNLAAADVGGKRRVVVVAFVGGVTFAEIAALRFLQSRPESTVDFIIVASKLVNGNSLLRSFQDEAVVGASAQCLL